MKLHDLDLLVEVSRFGSFAKVAERHGVDPSSISRQITGLENALGYRVFERTTRRLSLTEAGQITVDRIQAPLEELDQIFCEAKDTLTVPTGLLRVSASVAFGERWLAPRLGEFQTAYPGIKIDLQLTDRNIDLVAENVDVAIRLGERVSGSYVTSQLMQTRYRVVASPQYLSQHSPLGNPQDLANHNCLMFSLPGYRASWLFKAPDGRQFDVPISGSLSMSNALGLRRAALDGVGVALLSDWSIEEDLQTGALVEAFEQFSATATSFETAAWVIYPSKAYMPAKTRVFIDHMKANT